MKQAFFILAAIVAVLALMVVSGSFYTVNESQQVIITEFGKPKGDPITSAGLKFKVPFIQTVNVIEKRVLEWDGRPNEMPTKDKLYIKVDTFARWQISDPMQYFLRLRNERRAQSRLDDILGSETRNAVAKHDLIEMIRTTIGREPMQPDLEVSGQQGRGVNILEKITKGRAAIEKEIKENAKGKLAELGIDLLDVRFKRINYNEQVRSQIYERMISEREQIAELFRSEGNAEASRILGNKSLEVKKIESEAYKKVQEIRGEADAKATQIYAEAYNQSGEAAEFYEFIKTMETYSEVMADDTTVILSTESDLFKFLKSMDGTDKAAKPATTYPAFP